MTRRFRSRSTLQMSRSRLPLSRKPRRLSRKRRTSKRRRNRRSRKRQRRKESSASPVAPPPQPVAPATPPPQAAAPTPPAPPKVEQPVAAPPPQPRHRNPASIDTPSGGRIIPPPTRIGPAVPPCCRRNVPPRVEPPHEQRKTMQQIAQERLRQRYTVFRHRMLRAGNRTVHLNGRGSGPWGLGQGQGNHGIRPVQVSKIVELRRPLRPARVPGFGRELRLRRHNR